MEASSPELQVALFDLQRYLADQIPPLTASDAVETLVGAPPEVLMRQLQSWALEQSRYQEASQGDLLFHALRKIHVVSMLKLVDRGVMEAYIDRVLPLALQACPADERELLRNSIVALKHSSVVEAPAAVVPLSRSDSSKAKPSVRGAVSEAVTRSTKRLSMIVERLAKQFVGGVGETPKPVEAQPAAQLVSMAAASSTNEQELKEYLQQVSSYTGESDPLKLFHVLAAAVPQWEIAAPSEGKQSSAIEAMHKIIALTQDAQESARRLRELLSEAVSHFNEGALGAAVSMLELAAKVIREKKIDPSTVDRIFHDSVESISAEQLRKYAENKAKHAVLRRALSYFPTLTRDSLFDQLRGEQRPERRRSLLGLLEAYGPEARAKALDELEKELARPANEVDTYYLRNVIYLLHRIQRETDENIQKELELLTRSTSRGQNIYVVKEGVIPLGFLKSEAAAKVLTTRLAEFEVMLVRKDTTLYPMEEMQKVLDRITAALGRIATPAALLTIARHGMKPNPLFGDTRGRLAALAQHDLSFDEQTVDILVKAIRDDLPTKILGKVIVAKQPPLKLIEALSGTRAEKVELLLNEISEKFPDHDVGRAAAAALLKLSGGAGAASAASKPGAATLTGDLDFFGLPSLMQSLGDQQATGIVTLIARASGQTAGKLLFTGGKFVDAQTAHLRGVEALYQLLEKPVTGTFTFVPSTATPKSKDQFEIMPLLFEGIRRHDELRQMLIFVPDDLQLRAAGKPTPDAEETDPAVIREVWVKASSGARLGDWEPTIAVDSFRIRRLVGKWLEEGALQPAV